MWRKINYSKIYRKKINPNSCYISREGFFKEWTMREAYYKFSQDVNYLKANIQDIRSLNWTICVIEERFIISVCTSDEYVDEIMWKYIKVDQRTD
jgi:phosphopantetheinyl transferase